MALQTNVENHHVISISRFFDETTKILRVPSQKNNENYRNVYDPVIVSCGPYHYGKPQYERAQRFKKDSLDVFVSESHDENFDKNFYHGKILSCITEIRSCYDDVPYNDEELAWIILFDACFIIYFLQALTISYKSMLFVRKFGLGRINSIGRDLILFENQIPIWIFKFLLCLQSNSMTEGASTWEMLLYPFIAMVINGTNDLNIPLWNKYKNDIKQEPYHFLDAILIYYMLNLGSFVNVVKFDLRTAFVHTGYEFRSITNLNSKGIRLKASTDKTIRFTSYTIYGELELPPIDMTNIVLFANLIVYEMNIPDKGCYITSYINFLRSLIEGPNDVKIMREEGVLVGGIGSADDIYKMFKDIETYGVDNRDIFLKLKTEIIQHCRSKTQTSIAELINTYFRTPWTTIALVAAFILLCLTFLQTIFTMHPVKG